MGCVVGCRLLVVSTTLLVSNSSHLLAMAGSWDSCIRRVTCNISIVSVITLCVYVQQGLWVWLHWVCTYVCVRVYVCGKKFLFEVLLLENLPLV